MIPFPQDRSLGALEIEEVFAFYDEPLLFSCRNERDQWFVGVLAAADAERRTWLYAPVSKPRLDTLRAGRLPTYDTFRAVEGGALVRASVSAEGAWVVSWVDATTIGDDLLPLPDVVLDLEPADAPAHMPDVDRTARQIRRDVLAIRLELPNRDDHEAPAAMVGPVISGIQHALNAIGQYALDRPTDRAPIRQDVLAKVRVDVAGTFAGSFGIELRAHDISDLFGESPLVTVLAELIRLIQATADAAALRNRLGELRGRLPSKYRDLLLALSVVRQVDLAWGSPKPGAGGGATLTGSQVREALTVLGTLERRPPQEYTVVARLIGINVRTKTFEMYDEAEKVKYTGRVAPSAMPTVAGARIDHVYSVLIRETEEAGPTGEFGERYELLGLAGDERPDGSSTPSPP